MSDKPEQQDLHLVLVTGISGSGKSVALHALEDAGFNCVDNLPADLLPALLDLESDNYHNRNLAVAIDVRHAQTLGQLPELIKALQQRPKIRLKTLFLDASDETLVRRYSETRRLHPLSQSNHEYPLQPKQARSALLEAIALERDILANLRDQAHVLDTSFLKNAQLQTWVRETVMAESAQVLLVFESFAFKRGVPLNADYVFDVRMLPNPYYDPELRSLTGKDTAVAEFLRLQPEVHAMQNQIEQFLRHWLPALIRDHRSYVTVAIGCTGGQHRSVYLVESLGAAFCHNESLTVVTRHRELDGIARACEETAQT